MTTTKKNHPKKASVKLAAAKPANSDGKPKGPAASKSATKRDAPKKPSALDAAAKVLSEAAVPMTTGEMIDVMAKKGYWKSPGGQTPAATLYSAILRELKIKGKEARFTKADRGKFALSK